jgi:uncharacterized protein YqgC (DUF456 family)
MEWLLYVIAALFCLIGLGLVVSCLVSVPGGWIMLALALIIEFLDSIYLPAEKAQTFGWWSLGICAALLVIGELIELAASAAGVKGGGGTKRGMTGAIIGGIGGAFAFTVLLPIPPLGTLIGAVVGSFAGAVVGETTGLNARTVRGSMKPAVGATIGRIVGTMGKILLVAAVWAILSVAAFWP